MSVEIKLPPEDLAHIEQEMAKRTPVSKRKLRLPPRGVMVGALLAIVAAAVLVRSFVFTTGYDTTLVANVGVVRAPVSGVVRDLKASAGDAVVRDQPIGTFAAQVGLSAALRAGAEDVDQLRQKLASIDSRIQALENDAAQIRGEAQAYRSQKVSQLSAQGAEAGAAVAEAKAHQTYAEQQLRRVSVLAEKGFISAAGLDKARQDRDAAMAARAAAEARQRNEVIQTQAARQGLLLSSGYSDVQYSTQRLSDITLALNQLQGERDNTAAALDAALKVSRDGGKAMVRQLQVPLLASVNGRVWTQMAAAGETVQEGDPIYLLADCSSFFAYFTVHRRVYSNLSVGSPVKFVSFAHDGSWPGSVVNMGISDPAQLRITGPIPLPGPGEYLVGARFQLPAEAQRDCPVGTPGRVVI